jgi:hypothetical protein
MSFEFHRARVSELIGYLKTYQNDIKITRKMYAERLIISYTQVVYKQYSILPVYRTGSERCRLVPEKLNTFK